MLVLVLVWWALRLLPGLLTRVTVPAMAAGAVSATVLGLLVSQVLRIALDAQGMRYGLLYASGNLGNGVPAALTWGVVAGLVATATLRAATSGEEPAQPAESSEAGGFPEPASATPPVEP
ncbi:hypothetical protein GCM10019017_78050 [Streptomyces showdoensis]